MDPCCSVALVQAPGVIHLRTTRCTSLGERFFHHEVLLSPSDKDLEL